MMSRDVEGGVACSFLVTYFHEFVKERDIIGLLELYSDSSVITYAGYNEETTRVAHGRQNISEHLAKMDAELGRRKVEVRFADHTPLPGGCMQVACQGVVYLRGERWVFFQVFVLAPTPYRTNTYHVASDYMRVLAVEVEQIPEGSEVMTRAQLEQRLLEEQERRARIEEARERAAAAAEALRLQQAEALRLQQARERSEHNNNNTSVGKNISSSSNNNNNNDNNNNNNNNRNHNNNRRERTERGGDDRRRERADARRLGNNERNDNNNNQSERVERVNGGRHEERKELNGGRRWDRRERGDGGRAEGSGNTQSRDEKEPAASRPARLPRSREQPAENNNNNNRMGITRPVPRSQAAANRRIDGNENSNSNSNSNNRCGEKNTGDAVDTRPPRPRANRDRKDTDHVRLLRVPKEVKLTDISEVVVALLGTEPVDAYWHGRESANCVLRLPSSSVAERLVQDPITVLGTELKVVKFYP